MLMTPLAVGASPEGQQEVAFAALTAFVLQQQLSARDGVPNDDFGGSVALSGNTAVIGAPSFPFDGTSSQRGAAYVFIRSGTIWTFQAKLVQGDQIEGQNFGRTVAISGNIAVIGSPGANAVYVFRRSGNLWQQEARLTGDSSATRFGRSLSIDGNTVVVGADDEERRGAAFVFVAGLQSSPGAPIPWLQQQKLLAPSAQPGDNFGVSVVVRGNTIIAGASNKNVNGGERGAAFVFNRVSTVWTAENQAIVAPDGQDDDDFGVSVAFDGIRVAVAAPEARVSGISSGAVYVFVRQPAGWAFEQKLTPDVPRSDTDFGDILAIDGTFAVAGIPESSLREAFVFRLSGGVWARERVDPAQTTRLSSAALLGTTLLLGNTPSETPGTVEVLTDQAIQNSTLVPPVLAAPVVAGSTVRLNWSAVGAATRYQLRAGTSPGGSNAFNGDVGNTTALIATDVPNGSYFVRVFAATGSTESAASNEVRVDVGPGGTCQIPVAATNLNFSRSGSLVTLTWAATPNATSYIVEAGSAAGLSNIIVIDTGNAATQLVANAPPGTYFVRVRGKSACGTGAASNQVIITVS